MHKFVVIVGWSNLHWYLYAKNCKDAWDKVRKSYGFTAKEWERRKKRITVQYRY